jgi:hypothetical protein
MTVAHETEGTEAAAPTGDHHAAARGRALLLGLIAGALGGLLSLTWAVPVPGLGLVASVVGCLVPPRPFGAAGVLIGAGATWATLLLRASAACDPASCVGPDLAPWLLGSVVLVTVGIGLLAFGLRRSEPPSGSGHDRGLSLADGRAAEPPRRREP